MMAARSLETYQALTNTTARTSNQGACVRTSWIGFRMPYENASLMAFVKPNHIGLDPRDDVVDRVAEVDVR